jgi:hypothetical protein
MHRWFVSTIGAIRWAQPGGRRWALSPMTEHRTVEAHQALTFRGPLVAVCRTKAIVRQSQTSSPPSPEKSASLRTPIVSAAYKQSLTNRGEVMSHDGHIDAYLDQFPLAAGVAGAWFLEYLS